MSTTNLADRYNSLKAIIKDDKDFKPVIKDLDEICKSTVYDRDKLTPVITELVGYIVTIPEYKSATRQIQDAFSKKDKKPNINTYNACVEIYESIEKYFESKQGIQIQDDGSQEVELSKSDTKISKNPNGGGHLANSIDIKLQNKENQKRRKIQLILCALIQNFSHFITINMLTFTSRLTEIDMKIDDLQKSTDKRFDDLQKSTDKRFDDLDTKLDKILTEMNNMFNALKINQDSTLAFAKKTKEGAEIVINALEKPPASTHNSTFEHQ